MNRRQFHQAVTATAAALGLGATPPDTASGVPASVPPDPLPAGAAARLGCNRLWHLWPGDNPGLNDLTFSPDGRYLATLGYQDDHVFIWSVPDGRAVRDWEAQDADRGGSLLWTRQGLYVSSNGGLSLWEPLTASLIHRFTKESMRGLAQSADGRWVAAASFLGAWVEFWDTETRLSVARLSSDADRESRRLFGLGDFLLSVAFSRCGRWLAAGGYGMGRTWPTAGLVHCWDVAARRHLLRYVTSGGPVGRLAFTPTGHLLTADWAGTIALWEPLEGRLVRDWPRPQTGNLYRSLAANAPGQVALQREDGVYLWHPAPSRETVLCPARGFCHLAYSDDGRFVAVAGHSGRVEVYDAATGAEVSPPDRHAARVEAIEVTADGTVCLACLGNFRSEDAEVVLRDTRTGARLGAATPAGWRPLALAPAGTGVAGQLNESRLAVWDWTTGDMQTEPKLDPRVVAWHPDGQTLVVAADNGEVVTWHPGTDRGSRQPVSSAAPIMGLAVAAGGRAAALNEKGELFVWQVDQDEPPRRLAVPPPPSRSAYFSPRWLLALAPDGLSVAVSYGDGVVYAGPVAGAELRPAYTHPPGEEGAEDGYSVILGYTPAGRLLVAGSCSTLRDGHWWYANVVRDGLSGEVVWRSPAQPLWPTAMALSPDGRALLTGHEDGTVLVWPLPTERAGP